MNKHKHKNKNNIHGWLNIYKPSGISSSDTLGRLKKILRPSKIGHAGTLDPLARGILPVALGHCTKLIPFIQDDFKTYQFSVVWGNESNTGDLEGIDLAFIKNIAPPNTDFLQQTLPKFIGEILQKPHKYSAVKINGVRAYKLAREGSDFEIKPKKVFIKNLQILNNNNFVDTNLIKNTQKDFFCLKNIKQTTFIANVSKGTYIRTLASDIAYANNSSCFCYDIFRTNVGSFNLNNCHKIDDINIDNFDDKLLDFYEPLKDKLNVLSIDETQFNYVNNGMKFKSNTLLENNMDILLKYKNLFCALAKVSEGFIKPFKVFKY